METDKVEAFCQKFEEVVQATIHPDLLIPEIVIDAEISFADIRQSFYDILCQMEPFGPDNMSPTFCARRVYNTGWSKVVKDAHLRFVVRQDHYTMAGIGFNMADKMCLLTQDKPLDIVFKIDENEWNGQKSLQLKIVDCKLSED
jgi:single-stranded-DNA-specific exonuclease